MRILAVAGAPGVGKSTLFNALIPLLGEKHGTFRYGLCDYLLAGRTAVLGVYATGETFGGTDKLSMAVQEDAQTLLAQLNANRIPGVEAVAFEGDRLCNSKFLAACREAGELRFIVLTAPPALLALRRQTRAAEVGKGQDEGWLRGRETKVTGLSNTEGAELHSVCVPEETAVLAAELADWLKGLTNVQLKRPQRLF